MHKDPRFQATGRLSTPPASSIYNDAKQELENSNKIHKSPPRVYTIRRTNSGSGSSPSPSADRGKSGGGNGSDRGEHRGSIRSGSGGGAAPAGAAPRKLSPLTGPTAPNAVMADFRHGIYSSPLDARGTEEAVLTGKIVHRQLNARERVLSAPLGLESSQDEATFGNSNNSNNPAAAAKGLAIRSKMTRSSSLGGGDASTSTLAPSKQFIYEFPLWSKNSSSTASGPSDGDSAATNGGNDDDSAAAHANANANANPHIIRRSKTVSVVVERESNVEAAQRMLDEQEQQDLELEAHRRRQSKHHDHRLE